MKAVFVIIAPLLIVCFIACSKKDSTGNGNKPPNSKEEINLVADSIYLFSKEIYYWDEIRKTTYETFNPRQYVGTTDLATAEATIEAVRSYNQYDKEKEFSYATDYFDDEISSRATNPENSYGFFVKRAWSNRAPEPNNFENFTGWFVTYVFPNSDAGKKGVQRGWKMVKINNTMIGINDVDILNNLFDDQSIKSANIIFEKPGGEQVAISLSIANFVPSPILYSNVLQTTGGKKAGYLVYKFFDKLSDSQSDLNAAFQKFRNEGVTNIILDLRYNNGGYTETQDFLSNSLAPSSANGNTMYTYYYNNDLQAGRFTLMKTRDYSSGSFSANNNTEKFNTTGSLHPAKIYVIVSSGTASAAELFINNLKPVLKNNMVLIGDDNTYGKPVGFFPVDLFKKVTFWTVSFMTKNSNNDSVSYNGFAPNYKVYDGVDKSWGDATEDCVKAALNLIDGLSVTSAAATTSQTKARAATLPELSNIRLKKQYYDNMLVPR